MLGELVGRYLNDWIMHLSIRRNNGFFVAESRLWYAHPPAHLFHTEAVRRACYIAVAFYTCGMILLGAGFQKHLSIAAFIIGWGLVEIATILNTTVVCAPLSLLFARLSLTLHRCIPQRLLPAFQGRLLVSIYMGGSLRNCHSREKCPPC